MSKRDPVEELKMQKYTKGVWLQCELESQAKNKANPLEVLSERSRKKRAEEEAKRQSQVRDSYKISNSVIEFVRGDKDGYFRQFIE